MQREGDEQILRSARRLEGRAIHELGSPYPPDEVREHGGKGGFGQYLDNAWLGFVRPHTP